MSSITDMRRRFEAASDCKFVSPEVYLQRLTGRQSMVRADEPSANLLGLLDRNTGNRILVPVEDFMRSRTPEQLHV